MLVCRKNEKNGFVVKIQKLPDLFTTNKCSNYEYFVKQLSNELAQRQIQSTSHNVYAMADQNNFWFISGLTYFHKLDSGFVEAVGCIYQIVCCLILDLLNLQVVFVKLSAAQYEISQSMTSYL